MSLPVDKDKAIQAIIDHNGELTRKGEYAQANAILERELRLEPQSSWLHNELAWNLATSPKAETRDGLRAVKEATRACQLSRWAEAGLVDTLAAAYAETGDFTAAANWQQYALSLPGTPEGLLDEMNARLELYESGKAFREKL